MPDAVIPINPTLAIVLVVLAAVAATVTVTGGLGQARTPLFAAGRAAVQLAAVSGVIVVLLRTGWWAAFVLLMLGAATVTSSRRVTGRFRVAWTAVPVTAGVLPVLGLVLASGLVPLTGIAVIPIGGILTGAAMTSITLAGRRALDELRDRHGEYEAALALGFLPRPAALEVARTPASEALIPALDQTRTVGLVTLPGAYVGVLLGGASPLQAGAAQLLVLVGILAVQAVAALLTIELVARGKVARAAA
ncbi:MAG: ABC transporter permease [Thermocrispum sp.]